MKRIAILHYASPPTIGGVEATIAYHARGLADLGYAVRVISGSGSTFDHRVEVVVDPLLGSTHPDVLRVKRELDAGLVTPAFHDLLHELRNTLYHALEDCAVCIAHNIPTFNKNLPLSMALHSPEGTHQARIIAWCHDLAWTNPLYLPELHPGDPWEILREAWPGAVYVTVSEPRRDELADLLGIDPAQIHVIVPGVDPAQFFHWTQTMLMLEQRVRLLDADVLLLLPARITRRKNIQMGLRILAALRRQTGLDARLIVSGPPGPHNPTNPGYLGELLALRDELGLQDAAHFLYAFGESDEPLIPDDNTMANLYQIADGLLFPSTQEGFGIPILEAGLAGIPAFCADIPPLRKTGQSDAYYFDPEQGDPERIAADIHDTLQASATSRLRARARQKYRWDVLIREQIVPLLEDS